MDKHTVIDLLEQLAVLMELKGENPFKIRAYQNGARALETFDGDLAAAVETGELKKVKGIGAGLFADIHTLVTTGGLPTFEQLKAEIPEGLIEMLSIPGLGAKKVRAIHDGLGITTVGELEYACMENRLVDLAGFGEKTQAKVLKSIESWKKNRGRHLYADVIDLAVALESALAAHPAVGRAALAGGLRRRDETLDQLTVVVQSADPAAVNAALASLPSVESVEPQGDESLAARLTNGLVARVRVVPEAAYVGALLHETGNAAFLEALRGHAQAAGLTLSPEGLARDGAPLAIADEEAIFAALSLPVIAPELREGAEVVAQAAAGALPVLVGDQDLQGIFHVHTHFSDGEASLKDMALKAKAMGYRYIGISDHSEAAFYAHGLSREKIAEQQAEIRRLNSELDGITILSGIEADILADGSLDYDDETLASFDFVIGSVHSRFSQDRAAMTARLVKALSHPRLIMLGHMTGRLLLARDPYDFDLDAVLEAAAANGKIIELNANPHRLDMDWRDLQKARERGIMIAINPDAHSPEGLEHTRFGVAVARKGGLAASDVFNAKPLEEVLAVLKR
jgi:DNA polymerase (family 10)